MTTYVWALPRTLELHGRLGMVLGPECLAGLFTRVRPRPSSQAWFLVLTSISLRSLYNSMILLYVCNVIILYMFGCVWGATTNLTNQPFEAGMKSASVRYSWLLGWGMISIFSMYVLLTNVTVGHPIWWWIMWIMESMNHGFQSMNRTPNPMVSLLKLPFGVLNHVKSTIFRHTCVYSAIYIGNINACVVSRVYCAIQSPWLFLRSVVRNDAFSGDGFLHDTAVLCAFSFMPVTLEGRGQFGLGG